MDESADSASRPDHRELGNELDLFHFQDEAPGMVFWHPRGLTLYQTLSDAARRRFRREGYLEVRTPQVLRESIWQRSGHWTHYHADMFGFDDGKEAVALKPVSCPGHLEIIRRRSLSHRDLPLRVAEFGIVHRREPSGALHGLFRLRQFTQDDGHIFCTPEQLDVELARFATGLAEFYGGFDLDIADVRLSTRPCSRAGDDALWTRAESMLGAAASRAGLEWSEQPGAGAFYGPKLEFNLQDRWGRSWQCGTIQLDLVLPRQFGVHYAASDGSRQVPMMLHRALYGSLERFMGILLEHSGGRLAPWLAPEQVRVLPLGPAQHSASLELLDALGAAGLRAHSDASSETLANRIFRTHASGVPFAALIGRREVAAAAVTVRERGGRNQTLPRAQAIDLLKELCQGPQ
ncbi:MAG TPA: threonine--tRNA ligase [Steroidobacteraceae bacterium]|nr:threonine--tRNA ligase [Steroidobacteraceae bacterium]